MCSTLTKAKSTEGVQCIANVTPVMIWITKQAPNNEPKFHRYEMFVGCGASIKQLLSKPKIGCDLSNRIRFYNDI